MKKLEPIVALSRFESQLGRFHLSHDIGIRTSIHRKRINQREQLQLESHLVMGFVPMQDI
jgi:hypothetical protein